MIKLKSRKNKELCARTKTTAELTLTVMTKTMTPMKSIIKNRRCRPSISVRLMMLTKFCIWEVGYKVSKLRAWTSIRT